MKPAHSTQMMAGFHSSCKKEINQSLQSCGFSTAAAQMLQAGSGRCLHLMLLRD